MKFMIAGHKTRDHQEPNHLNNRNTQTHRGDDQWDDHTNAHTAVAPAHTGKDTETLKKATNESGDATNANENSQHE